MHRLFLASVFILSLAVACDDDGSQQGTDGGAQDGPAGTGSSGGAGGTAGVAGTAGAGGIAGGGRSKGGSGGIPSTGGSGGDGGSSTHPVCPVESTSPQRPACQSAGTDCSTKKGCCRCDVVLGCGAGPVWTCIMPSKNGAGCPGEVPAIGSACNGSMVCSYCTPGRPEIRICIGKQWIDGFVGNSCSSGMG